MVWRAWRWTSTSPWPAQSPDFNIIEPLWTVLETRVRNRFPPPTSLKQIENLLLEEWHKIPLETVQNVYESIPRLTAALLKTKFVQDHINKKCIRCLQCFHCFVQPLYIIQISGFPRITEDFFPVFDVFWSTTELHLGSPFDYNF
jgi:hypothetical protein